MAGNSSEKGRLSAEERRCQILDKAAEVFAVHGVAGTRTRDIAEACGINEALLYRHFPGKDELYREAMIHSYEEAAKGWRALAAEQRCGLFALIAILRRQLTLLRENPILSANMWHGVASAIHDPIMKELVRERFDINHEFLVEMVKQGQADGSIIEDVDPDRTAWFMRGITWSFILRSVLEQETGEASSSPEDFCSALFARLATRAIYESCTDPETEQESKNT